MSLVEILTIIDYLGQRPIYIKAYAGGSNIQANLPRFHHDPQYQLSSQLQVRLICAQSRERRFFANLVELFMAIKISTNI